MRIRSTKPEFWRSSRIGSVDWAARLVLKGLESYVDDNGVGKDDLALICADVFPRDLSRNPTGTLQKVSEAISALSDAGLLWRYEANGTGLLYIAFWESVQRIEKPSKGRFPRPDGTLEYRESEIRESSSSTPGILPEPSGLEQRISRSVEQGISISPPLASLAAPEGGERDDDPILERWEDQRRERDRERSKDQFAEFDAWYAAYPRKIGKGQAMKAYKSARKKATAETLLAAVNAQRDHLVRNGRDYCPHPATWLNGERWLDDISTSQPGRVSRHQQETDDLFDAAMVRARAADAADQLAIEGTIQ